MSLLLSVTAATGGSAAGGGRDGEGGGCGPGPPDASGLPVRPNRCWDLQLGGTVPPPPFPPRVPTTLTLSAVSGVKVVFTAFVSRAHRKRKLLSRLMFPLLQAPEVLMGGKCGRKVVRSLVLADALQQGTGQHCELLASIVRASCSLCQNCRLCRNSTLMTHAPRHADVDRSCVASAWHEQQAGSLQLRALSQRAFSVRRMSTRWG